jgi:hypothetical protein
VESPHAHARQFRVINYSEPGRIACPQTAPSRADGYQLGENLYEFWLADGKFGSFWWYRVKKQEDQKK